MVGLRFLTRVQIVQTWGISILARLDLAGGLRKQSGTCHFQSGPNESPVRSNTIPDFRDITVDLSPSTCGRCIVPILALG